MASGGRQPASRLMWPSTCALYGVMMPTSAGASPTASRRRTCASAARASPSLDLLSPSASGASSNAQPAVSISSSGGSSAAAALALQQGRPASVWHATDSCASSRPCGQARARAGASLSTHAPRMHLPRGLSPRGHTRMLLCACRRRHATPTQLQPCSPSQCHARVRATQAPAAPRQPLTWYSS